MILSNNKIYVPWMFDVKDIKSHRVLRLNDLPINSSWGDIKSNFSGYSVEHYHFFGNKALIQFYSNNDLNKYMKNKTDSLNVEIFCLPSFKLPNSSNSSNKHSVLCLTFVDLRIAFGICEIRDVCSLFGTVEKIVCFEKNGKHALVKMSTVKESELVIANLSENPVTLPYFQLVITYSLNSDISVKCNNSKSYDFTLPDSDDDLLTNKDLLLSDYTFFYPDEIGENRYINSLILLKNTYTQKLFMSLNGDVNTDYVVNLLSVYGFVESVYSILRNDNIGNTIIKMDDIDSTILASIFLNRLYIFGTCLSLDVMDETYNPIPHFNSQEQSERPNYTIKRNMVPPTNKVGFHPKDINLKQFSNINIQNEVLIFDDIQKAAEFICCNNFKVIDDTVVNLFFVF